MLSIITLALAIRVGWRMHETPDRYNDYSQQLTIQRAEIDRLTRENTRLQRERDECLKERAV